MLAPGLGRPQCQVIKQPIWAAERWESTLIVGDIAGESTRHQAHSNCQAYKRSPVSDAPIAEIHGSTWFLDAVGGRSAYAVALEFLGDVGLDAFCG
jgi:hypothetical protein